jgi:hypothetical protein
MKRYYKNNKLKMAKQMKEAYIKDKPFRLHYQKVRVSEEAAIKKYDRPVKNLIREKIVSEIETRQIKNILTLESKDFLFSKLIPNKKIYVFEKDKLEFDSMLVSKPKNVILNQGDVSNFKEYDINPECIYLDFCGAFNKEKSIVWELKEKIKSCKLFVLTVCTWDETKSSNGDYQFDLINQLQSLLEINFKVIWGQGYRDKKHSTMVTVILENTNVQ